MSDLSIADEVFASEVAKGKSQAEAYRISRPDTKATNETIWAEASRIANDHKVRTRISELKHKTTGNLEISVARVLKERARLAFYNPKDLLHNDGTPKSIHELDDDTAAAIIGLDVVNIGSDGDKVGQVNKIKMADKNASLLALERHLGMNKDIDLGNGVLNISINLG